MMIGSLIFSKESFALLVFDFLILMYLCSFALQFASDDSIFKYFYLSFIFNTEREHSPPYRLSSRTSEYSQPSGGKWSKIRCASSCKLPW